MADDQELAHSVRAALAGCGDIREVRMFGGITFLLDGNMLCCASKKGLMVRVGAAAEPLVLESPHASPCLGTGRPMAGFIMINPAGLAKDGDLKHWIGLARVYVEKLPAKPEKPRASSSRAISIRPEKLHRQRTKKKK